MSVSWWLQNKSSSSSWTDRWSNQ